MKSPALADWLLRLLLPQHLQSDILGDLQEEFRLFALDNTGPIRARLWYWRQVLSSSLKYRIARGRNERIPSRHRRPAVESVVQDIRFAVRTLLRRPLFAVVAIGTLGLGIGAATTIFTAVEGVLLRRLPYERPGELVNVWVTFPQWRGQETLDAWWDRVRLSYPDYEHWRDGTTLLQETAAYGGANMVFPRRGGPTRIRVGSGTASLLSVLGVQVIAGRWFLPGEDGPTHRDVVVLSDKFWRDHFGRDPNAVGQTISLDNRPFIVVGVLPPNFRLRETIDWSADRGFSLWRTDDAGEHAVWVPLGTAGRLRSDVNRFEGIGRLKPGATFEQARVEAELLIRAGESPDRLGVRMAYRTDLESSGLRAPISLLSAAAGILLLITCGNVATMLMGEATGRRREIATRAAIGAGTGRIVRQLLTESVLLGLLGSAVGTGLAIGGTELLTTMAPPMARIQEMTVNGTVLAFASLAGVATGLAFGLAPSLMTAGHAFGQALRSDDRLGTKRGRLVQRLVVSSEIALTVVLLVSAGLFARTLANLFAVDLGFNSEGLAVVRASLPRGRIATANVFEEMVAQMAAIPGVERASGTSSLPFLDSESGQRVVIEGRKAEEGLRNANDQAVLPGFLETMEIPLLSGRALDRSDGPEAQKVALVSESMARLYWPNESPVGARIMGAEDWWLTVVGIVGDVKHTSLDSEARATFYCPVAQDPRRTMTLVARTTTEPIQVGRQMQQAVRNADPGAVILSVDTMESLISLSGIDQRYRAVLVALFGITAVLLAAVGIFGVTARNVALRTRELGIRAALGATGQGLIGMVLRGSLMTAITGTAVGLAGALLVSRLLEGFLFEVETTDPLTYAAVVSLLAGVCFVASYLPTRRVAKVNPVVVLRAE